MICHTVIHRKLQNVVYMKKKSMFKKKRKKKGGGQHRVLSIRSCASTLLTATEYLCHKWQQIFSFVVIIIRFFPHSWLIIGFVRRVTRYVPLVKQEPAFTTGYESDLDSGELCKNTTNDMCTFQFFFILSQHQQYVHKDGLHKNKIRTI
jgi:hypothetical protein